MVDKSGWVFVHDNGGCVGVPGCCQRNLVQPVVGHRVTGPGIGDDVGGTVKLSRLDRSWCGRGWYVNNGLNVPQVKEGGQGYWVGGGRGGSVV